MRNDLVDFTTESMEKRTICWNCGEDIAYEDCDTEPISMTDSETDEKVYVVLCPHCGVVVAYLSEDEIY